MAEERVAREEQTFSNPEKDVGNEGSSTTTTTTTSSTDAKIGKGKSCKGCLYYSSALKSNARNPLCVGFTRSLPQVPRYIGQEYEVGASKEGRDLSYFKYGCVGYSVYPDLKNRVSDIQDSQTELPACLGVEVLLTRGVNNAESSPAPSHNKQEDDHGLSQRPSQKPAHSVRDEFLSRFTRNANLVAMGVVKNMRKLGNQIKESLDDVLYPYRRRPK